MTFGRAPMKIMATDNMIVPGLLIALGCGAAVGIFNYGLIRLLRIPPIIATLSSSFLNKSAAIAYGRTIKPPPLLANSPPPGLPAFRFLPSHHRPRTGRRAWCAPHGLWPIGVAIGQNSRAAPVGLSGFHPLRHLRDVRDPGRPVRLPALRLFRRCRAQHGGGVPAGLDRGGGDRRHVGRRRVFQCARSVGRRAVHVPAGDDAEHVRPGRRVRLVLTGLIIIAVITLAGGKTTDR